MRITSKLGRIAAVVTVSGVVLLGATTASAYEPFATSAPLAKDSVTGPGQIKDGTVYGADLAPGMTDWFTTVYNGSVHEIGLDANLKGKLANGSGSVVKTVPATKIEFIGGPFNDPARGKTLVGSFDLPAGTWLLTTAGKFTRTEAAAAGEASTRPMLGLRYDETATNAFGEDAGTIMGADISPVIGQDLTGSAVQTVTLTKTTSVKVYAFGYDDARGSSASGKITAAAQITATRIG